MCCEKKMPGKIFLILKQTSTNFELIISSYVECRQNEARNKPAKIWDVRKSQKWSHPLQDDEIKWLADRINKGRSTPQELQRF